MITYERTVDLEDLTDARSWVSITVATDDQHDLITLTITTTGPRRLWRLFRRRRVESELFLAVEDALVLYDPLRHAAFGYSVELSVEVTDGNGTTHLLHLVTDPRTLLEHVHDLPRHFSALVMVDLGGSECHLASMSDNELSWFRDALGNAISTIHDTRN